MKKILLAFSLSCLLFSASFAQDLLTKVPANATMVIKYSGENFGKSVPLQKLDSYGFIRSDLFKMLKIDTLTSLQNTGIDLTTDSYQYVEMSDTTMSFVTIVHLKDTAKFSRFMMATLKKGNKTEEKNGFHFFSIDDGAYIAMNDKIAVISKITYDDHQYYWSNNTTSDTTIVVTEPHFSDITIDAPPPPPPPPPAMKKPTVKQKPVTGKKPVTVKKAPVTKVKPPVKKKPEIVEDPVEETIGEVKVDGMIDKDDSSENLKRELWYQQKELATKKREYDIAEKIATQVFSGNILSIGDKSTYQKVVDPAAHVSIWLNSNDLMMQYSKFYSRGFSGLMGIPGIGKDSLGGFSAGSNIYFDKDKMRVEQKSFSADPEFADLGKALMNSRQNPALANYVNPGNIGFFSMSINTEAMATYYYRLMKQYMSSTSYMREYSDVIDVYIDFLEIAIDEKALSDLFPGNLMFVMHDLKPKTVTFTDYTYDSEYNKTETKGTRTEISPDFSVIFETKKEAFMQKLAKLPLKFAEKEHYQYFDRGGYYEFVTDSSNIVGNLYFMVKDGKALVTTSKEVVELTLSNKGFAIDADTKKSILNNNYSMKINSSKLLEKLGGEFTTATNKKITDYLIDNIGDVKMESSLKDGMIQSTTTMNIKGSHSNSLEFFFNMIDSINNIIEKDKQGKLNKLD